MMGIVRYQSNNKQIYYHFPILLFSVSITFFCWVRINSLFAKFFLSSFNYISITLYSSSCYLYFFASRLQCVTSFYKFPIFFSSLARPSYSLCRHYSFYENLSKERSCLSREASRERRRELLDWFDFMDRLELARFSCGCGWGVVFSCDFLEVTESRMDFFYWEDGLGLFFSLEYLGWRTDQTYVLILRQGTVGVVLACVATLVLTVLLPACYCFFRQMARCITRKSSSLFSSYYSSSSEGQEQRNLLPVDFCFSLLAQRRKRAVSQLPRVGSFCYRKARLFRFLPSFSFTLYYSSSSDSSETLSIFLYSSISFRYSSPISFFFVLISPSRTM